MIRHAYPCFIYHLPTINHQNGYFALPTFLFRGKSSFTKSKLSLYRQWWLSSMLGTLLDPFPLIFFHFLTFWQNERLYLHLEKGSDTTLFRAHRLTLTCILTKVSQMCTSLMNPVASLMHMSYNRVSWLCWLCWRRSTKVSKKIEPFSCCERKQEQKKKKSDYFIIDALFWVCWYEESSHYRPANVIWLGLVGINKKKKK